MTDTDVYGDEEDHPEPCDVPEPDPVNPAYCEECGWQIELHNGP